MEKKMENRMEEMENKMEKMQNKLEKEIEKLVQAVSGNIAQRLSKVEGILEDNKFRVTNVRD
jgi:tetrahydromethanopterin S-methyltransferase subunit G